VDKRQYDKYQNLIIDEDGNPVPGAAERTRRAQEMERRELERAERERLSGKKQGRGGSGRFKIHCSREWYI
jgi:hypothetical protein